MAEWGAERPEPVYDAEWREYKLRWAAPFRRTDGSRGWTDGYRVGTFIEGFCRITRGKFAGQLTELREWQVKLLVEIFETSDPAEGPSERTFRRGLLGLPRKNGKSMLGAGIALYALMFDEEEGAEVYSCAGDREQAKVVFNEAARMVELDADLGARLDVVRSTSRIYHHASGSVYRALSAEAYTKEGLNPSCVIFDEVHVQPDDSLWNVMTLGSAARRRPLTLGITTAGWDKNTLCGRLYDLGKAGAPGFFFRWWEAPPGCDHRDHAVWTVCNPGLGDFLYLRAVEDELYGSAATSEASFRRYRLNQWTSSMEAWFTEGVFEARACGRALLPHEALVLGVDGSFNNDSTGIVACTLDFHLATLGVWERPLDLRRDEEWRVPIQDVEARIEALCSEFDVLEVALDPFRWQRTAEVLQERGLPVVYFPTTSPARMVPATKDFEDAVCDGGLTHDGNEALVRHVANAMLKTDRLGARIVKEHKHSTRKIDLAVCAVVARDRAAKVVPPPVPQIW